jgi:hypothetical protein
MNPGPAISTALTSDIAGRCRTMSSATCLGDFRAVRASAIAAFVA